MSRSVLLDLLSEYNTVDIAEQEMLRETIAFVKAHENCFSRELLVGHVTGSAWIVNPERTHALLMHHKKLNRWFQPGGHCDGDPDVQAVAAKEALEETGLDVSPLSSAVLDVDVHVIPERKDVPEHKHYDVRFLFSAKMDREQLAHNEESNEVRWIALENVHLFNDSESIGRLVKKVIGV
ncbi:NUDIX hydrolase [Terrimonas sp. NA20]|uniref:NUDIX hydrolase n=1 Tax=Terrimonas ginsenosidimutans TaxID=2908004 RepID=A0ABS9KWU8_9BACT|nr:NUDIX hydrolase [Terrimonas ginsenosidimutans]MCG2616821.1 NUDIX hydrolase [Terrimonas ginsenosidimutans]